VVVPGGRFCPERRAIRKNQPIPPQALASPSYPLIGLAPVLITSCRIVHIVSQSLICRLIRPGKQHAGVHAVIVTLERTYQLVRLEAADYADQQVLIVMSPARTRRANIRSVEPRASISAFVVPG
jgi:hypothetical protein